MNRKLYSIVTVVAVAFALVLGFGVLNPAKAVPGETGDGYKIPAGQVSQFGLDFADNSAQVKDKDARNPGFIPDSYGLSGTSQN